MHTTLPEATTDGETEQGSRKTDTELSCINLTLRNYMFKQGELYYAHCIDLDLGVLRPTREEAIGELHAMIESYLDEVIELGCPRHLLYRRSGLVHRLRYHWASAVCGLRHLLRRSPSADPYVKIESKQLYCPV